MAYEGMFLENRRDRKQRKTSIKGTYNEVMLRNVERPNLTIFLDKPSNKLLRKNEYLQEVRENYLKLVDTYEEGILILEPESKKWTADQIIYSVTCALEERENYLASKNWNRGKRGKGSC